MAIVVRTGKSQKKNKEVSLGHHRSAGTADLLADIRSGPLIRAMSAMPIRKIQQSDCAPCAICFNPPVLEHDPCPAKPARSAEPFWPLDPAIQFLNHGSFGSCPLSVQARQQMLRQVLERDPVQFLVRDLEAKMDEARAKLAAFVGADRDDLVFVPNATSGINTVLRSLEFSAGDELLVTNHEYNACRNALDFVASRSGARVLVVEIPFPLSDSSIALDRVIAAVTERTRLVLIDHVTSQTGMVLPLKGIIHQLTERGVDVLVDGAHAPGMIPLKITELNPTYYTGNCHKWLCAPKGAGFLYVQKARQSGIRPLTISHGANSMRTDRSRFQVEFGWTGTADPTPYLCVPAALEALESQVLGGWAEVMRRNRELALGARRLLCDRLGIAIPCPDEMIGALASIPLPDSTESQSTSPLYSDPLQTRLRSRHGIEVPVIPWPRWPKRLLRISAQLYNSLPQYAQLAEAIRAECPSPR